MYTRVLTPGLSAAPTTMDHSPPDLSISPHRRDSSPFYFHPPADTKLLPTPPSLPPSPIVTTTTNNIPHHQPTTHVNEHLQVQTVQTMNLPLTHYEEVNVLPVAAHHMNTAHNQDHNQGVSPLWSSATTTTSSSSRSSRSNSNSNSSETNSNLNDWERSPELALEGCCFAQHVRVLPDSRKKEFRGKGLQSIALPHYNIPKKEVRFFPRAFVEYTTSAILINRISKPCDFPTKPVVTCSACSDV